MITILIKRTKDTGKETLGELSTVGFSCKTLERPWKENKTGISCIPKGEYICIWTFSPKLMRYTYQVTNVKGRSGIRFHPGNYFFDIEGCILLGNGYTDLNKDSQMDIINSTKTTKAFELLFDKKPFKLQII
jgi:hypothetical protein